MAERNPINAASNHQYGESGQIASEASGTLPGIFDWVEHHKLESLAIAAGAVSVSFVATRLAGVEALASIKGEGSALKGLQLRTMRASDLPSVVQLVKNTEGLSFRPEETVSALERAIKINPGLSQVAVSADNRVVGGVFVGETGLRGMINHLAVDPVARQDGLGTALVQRSLKALYETTPVRRVYASVLADNETAMKFWSKIGRQATGRDAKSEVVTYIIDLEKQPWLKDLPPLRKN